MDQGDMWVFCETCRKRIGKYKMYFAQEHLKKYPAHTKGFVVTPEENYTFAIN